MTAYPLDLQREIDRRWAHLFGPPAGRDHDKASPEHAAESRGLDEGPSPTRVHLGSNTHAGQPRPNIAY